MPNTKTDPKGFNTESSDRERDAAAKGGPSTSLGQSDAKHGISSPFSEDLQAQIAAKGKKKDAPQEQKH